MAITVRDVHLVNDREEVIRFLRENLTPHSDDARYDWLYLSNPCGRARAWMAVDGSNKTIGVAAAFPRQFSIVGKTQRTWVLGDFCIDKQYRTLGPALQLQRALLESLTSDEQSICYDFPSKTMMSVYGRLGVRPLGIHVRHVKLLSVDHKLQQYAGKNILVRPLSRIANCALALGQKNQSMPEGVEFSMQESKFGDEFNSMQSRQGAEPPIRLSRSAEYLNWRYICPPVKHYCAVTARRQSEVVGYGMAEIDGDHSLLADVYTVDNDKYLPGILAYLELLLRDLNVYSISASVLEECHLIPYLRRAGFRPREGAPVIAYANGSTNWDVDVRDAKNWMLLNGDRDS